MPEPPDTIREIIKPAAKDLGEFTVRRTLPSKPRQRVGPFIFFDHMGPAEFAPGSGVSVRPHPHIGIATITFLFEGEIMHRDSLGYVQAIRPGAVNWMTAGSGIVHSERSPEALLESGSRLHGIQSWIALPLEKEEIEPRFEHYPADRVPAVDVDGAQVTVIAGGAYGVASPVRTESDMLYVDAVLPPGATLDLPEDVEELAVYAVEGTVHIDGLPLEPATMAVLTDGASAELSSPDGGHAMLLGGDRLAGDRTLWWNFVSSSRERIERAKADWQEGRFDKVPGDDEFIPLPGKE